MANISQKFYLIQAIYEWCIDNGYTPYLTVLVDKYTQVPMTYVTDNAITLNISHDAVSALHFSNDFIECSARFDGKKVNISVPMGNVLAIYARENGEGLTFKPTLMQGNTESNTVANQKIIKNTESSKKVGYDSNLTSKESNNFVKSHLKLIK